VVKKEGKVLDTINTGIQDVAAVKSDSFLFKDLHRIVVDTLVLAVRTKQTRGRGLGERGGQ
jgi:hypothetical protein